MPRILNLCSLALLSLAMTGCGGPNAPAIAPPDATSTTSVAEPAPPPAPIATEEVKLMKEYWETGKLKYWNEMRKDAAGKWQKTGIGRAYYSDGILEREGLYKEGTRVGIWKYYGDDGTLSRTEDRGEGKPGGA